MSEIETIIAEQIRKLPTRDADHPDSELDGLRARETARAIIAALDSLGYVVVSPYDRIVVQGEGADEEYQLIPTRQIETYLQAIEMLKARK